MDDKDKILKLPEVIARTKVPRSSIYVGMNNGTFPKNVKIGKRLMGWREKDIDNWIKNLEEYKKYRNK